MGVGAGDGGVGGIAVTVRIHLGGAIDLYDLPLKSLENLQATFRLSNPLYHRAVRAGRDTGDLVPFRCYAEELPSGALRLPRGAIDRITRELERDGTDWVIERDDRTLGDALPGTMTIPSLRSYQEKARQRLIEHEQGLVVLPCGTGKTRCALAVVLTLGRTALILVPTNDLAEQWQAALREHGVDAGLVCGGKDQHSAPVVIGTEFSLVGRLEKSPSLGRRFGLFVVDEAHRIPAATLSRCRSLVHARYALGLTASTHREDGQGPAVEWAMGPKLLECTPQELMALGVLMPAEIEFLSSTFSCDKAARAPAGVRTRILEQHLVEDVDRARLVAERIAIEHGRGESVLVLTGRKEHAVLLGSMLKGSYGLDVPVLTGETTTKTRRESLQAMRDGQARAVIATTLADEGLDIQRLSRLVLAFPSKAKGKILQRVGRVMRLYPGKKPKVIDVTDPLVPALERRRRERVKVYRDLGLMA